ncbi:hypothetical protein ACLBWS_01680 [Brucellaceae bacterium D45D]
MGREARLANHLICFLPAKGVEPEINDYIGMSLPFAPEQIPATVFDA